MGIFYSISISEKAYTSKKNIQKILNQYEHMSVKSLSKNYLSIFLIDYHQDDSDFVKIMDKINQEEQIKIITDFHISELNVINCNRINDYEPLSTLKNCLQNELKLDQNLSYNDIVFHEKDIKMMEYFLRALFYNLYDDNLSYDKAFLHAMSYVSTKSIHTKSEHKTMIVDRLVYSCLKNWYEKYYTYKKDLFKSYNNYYDSIRQILEDDNYLSSIKLFKSHPLNKTYYYYIEQFIKDIKTQKYGINTYEKFLKTELALNYKTPTYKDTDYEKLFKLSNQFIKDTEILLQIINYWMILYNIQVSEKNNTVNNIVIYTKQKFQSKLLLSLHDMGFSDL
jgi:hypothetical protein